jgi:transposase InsO family protein
MRSRAMREFFLGLGVTRLFARPRTPNDNPSIELLFSIVKTHPVYPEAFPTLDAARGYFEPFFHWYNHEHLHARIGMVAPHQKHSGEWQGILAERQDQGQDLCCPAGVSHRSQRST